MTVLVEAVAELGGRLPNGRQTFNRDKILYQARAMFWGVLN
jgi:hypothetical protein